ncbi:MAG: DEAD/DEAH box helicase family protein [Pirellulaceae bacterium]
MSNSKREIQFQKAAVDRIVEALHGKGSRRFLLADEVGLGKTIIAAEVVAKLFNHRRTEKKGSGPFKIVYLCSSGLVSSQNAERLIAPIKAQSKKADKSQLKRLTLYANEAKNDSKLDAVVYGFTPGTSMTIGGRTGTMDERKLLLYLLGRTRGWHEVEQGVGENSLLARWIGEQNGSRKHYQKC